MHLSIRLRVIIALNVFVICLTLALGWVAREVAGRIVEERFAKEMVAGVSEFLSEKGFPHSDSMMGYLRQIFDADWVVLENGASNIVSSSLALSLREEFSKKVGNIGQSGAIFLNGTKYRMDSAEVSIPSYRPENPAPCRLYMLVPYALFQEARDNATKRVTWVVFIAAAVATGLAILFAFTITHPIRRLASEMDSLSENNTADEKYMYPPAIKGPSEIMRLTASFHNLMNRLRATRNELTRNERLVTLGKVCLSVAHELRNPLSGIKMNMRVLKDNLESHDPGIEIVLREIDRMELYISELMSFSPETQSDPRELNRVTVRLSDLAESVHAILSGRCRHSKIIIQKDYSAEEPALFVDANQIRQAMMNLMVNAIEAMPNGGTMKIAVQCAHNTAIFSVADTGKGVRCDENNIFDAFISGKPNGVGLGLYLCKQIVERHGGSIKYDSSEKGAIFWFELPVRITTLTGNGNNPGHYESEHH